MAESDHYAVMSKRRTPYEVVIDKFRGVRKLAHALGIDNHTSVLRWKDKGLIPAHHQERVLTVAKERGIDLTAEEVIFGSPAKAEPEPKEGGNVLRIAA